MHVEVHEPRTGHQIPRESQAGWWSSRPALSTSAAPAAGVMRLFPRPIAPMPSQGGDDLRPDCDHADEQGQGRQRGGFFNNRAEHLHLPANDALWNEGGTLFILCSSRQAPEMQPGRVEFGVMGLS